MEKVKRLLFGDRLPAFFWNYTLSAKQLEEFNYFDDLKTIQVDLINQGKCILDLDSTQVLHIVDIADQSEWIAGQQARNILNFAYGYDYQPDIILPVPSGGSRLAKPEDSREKNQRIYAFPNPASEQVTFHYNLGEHKSNSMIRVYNIIGEIIMETPIDQKEGFSDWNTKEVKAGLYFYSIIVGNETIESGQVVIVH